MSGSIRRINTCENCAYMEVAQDPGEPPKMLCRRNPPVAHPLVAFVADKEGAPSPRLLGTIAVWPEVRPEQWCGHHSTNRIEHAREIPKQMQTFGGVHRG
jgi:hypothetical protein